MRFELTETLGFVWQLAMAFWVGLMRINYQIEAEINEAAATGILVPGCQCNSAY